MNSVIVEKIQQRRLQILVHSCIYYEYNTNIISDAKWNQWSKELVELQKEYPNEASKALRFEDFKNFDGSTGFDLPIHDECVKQKALKLMSYTQAEAKRVQIKKRKLF